MKRKYTRKKKPEEIVYKPRTPDPSPEQIEKRAKKIRENWSEQEHRRRSQLPGECSRVELKPISIHVEEE